jgi:hypothetical protein
VSGEGENPENAPFNRGDLGEGEAPRPALAIEVRFAGFWDWSGRLLFRDLSRPVSGSGRLRVVVEVNVGDSAAVAIGAADTGPCSEAMRPDV